MSKAADLETLGNIRRALETDARIPSADQVHIAVENGNARLWGEVASPAEKAAAESIARAQGGTKDVENALTVAMVVPALDTGKKLCNAVYRALAASPELNPRDIGIVSVDRGTVRLTGRVHSLAEENAAIALASTVPGVRQVVSEVIIGEADPGQAIEILDDTALRSLVDKAIAERGVTIYDERTLVSGGIVYLRGRVVDPRQARLAEAVAAAIPGVKDTVNELLFEHAVTSRDPNEALAAQVTEALGRDGRVSPAQVHVESVAGDIYLFGFVDSIEQQNAAIAVARSVPGVRNVFSDVVIVDRSTLGGVEKQRGIERGGV